ncbi:hypothetical protein BN946_scf184999.g7 [Trametes cinnabarina]|uniref:Uncharacterized protein n=1 Tax=Pycnoporus cinnabarinus TaxID=5643 RepID=A0A060S7C2_PYCCI|nr:hypothetical protein BN946_scf184999.g7 [Trametes cinnabarina]
MGHITVVNNSPSTVYVMVSKYTAPQGGDGWYAIPSQGSETWGRSGWELVAFKNASDHDTKRAGVYVNVDSIVTFDDFHHHISVKTE